MVHRAGQATVKAIAVAVMRICAKNRRRINVHERPPARILEGALEYLDKKKTNVDKTLGHTPGVQTINTKHVNTHGEEATNVFLHPCIVEFRRVAQKL